MNISVVIPCFNCSNTIEACLKSVFEQTVLPKEVIVINDGSTDDTLDKLEKIKTIVPPNVNYYIFSQLNSGPSVARNYGISKASGEWISFLDSDDYWDIENLKNFNNFIYNNKQYVLIGGGNFIDTLNEVTFNKLLFKNYFQTSTTVVKRQTMLQYLFNEKQRFSEDYRSWLLIVNDNKACNIVGYKATPVIFRNTVYSGGGLSSKLWDMEKGELSNYLYLLKSKKISFSKFIVISLYSYTKYFRRWLIK